MIHMPYPRLCSCGIVHRPTGCCGKCAAHKLRPYDGMYLSADAKNRMLDAMDESQSTGMAFASLHSAFSTSGTNELSGGSYARQALTWSVASLGAKQLGSPLPTWSVPGPTTVAWVGFWDLVAGGVFKGMVPAGGGLQQRCSAQTSADISSTTLNAQAHGLVANQQVVFWGSLPLGLAVGTIYWVRASGLTANSFSVAASSGGSAMTVSGTVPFNFFVQPISTEAYAGTGVYTLTQATVSLLEQAPAGAATGSTFTCTEIVGFSVTESWYGLAPFQPSAITGFIQTVPHPERWQLRWASGGSIDQWAAGNFFSGWTDPNNLISQCAANSGAPDRVIVNVSGNYSSDPTSWATYMDNVSGFIWSTYSPGVKTILMQSPVAGPGGGTCPTSDPLSQFGTVRATYNTPYIRSGIPITAGWINGAQALNNYGPYSGTFGEGAISQVSQCSDYADWAGHIITSAQATAGQQIAAFYG